MINPKAFFLPIALFCLLPPLVAQVVINEPEDVASREEWFYGQRVAPTGTIPLGFRERALAQIRQAGKASPKTSASAAAPRGLSGNGWVNVGPAPIGNGQIAPPGPVSGRVTTIAVDPRDPNHWLIGGAQGGIWETRDAGLTWRPLTDSQASLAMGSIAFSESNPSIIYAGTGEAAFSADSYAGSGMLKSTDGGATWRAIGITNFSGNAFSDVKVSPTDPNTVIVGLVGAIGGRGPTFFPAPPARGIYRTTDGGATWTQNFNGSITDIEIDPTNFRNQYAGVLKSGLIRSSDGGLTWAPVSGPWNSSQSLIFRVELAISKSSPGTLYISISDAQTSSSLGVWRTDNATALAPTWVQLPAIPTPGDQFWYDHDIVVDPLNPNILYLGETPLWKFDGTTWTAIAGDYNQNVEGRFIHPDQHILVWSGSRLIVGNDGGVFSTTDGGATFQNHNSNLSITQFYDGSVHPFNPNFALAGAQDNGTSQWTGNNRWNFVFSGDGADNAISGSRPNTDWAVSSQGLNIARTTDGGNSFVVGDNGIDHTGAPFIGRFEKAPFDDNLFIAGTVSLWKCTNFFGRGLPSWVRNGPIMPDGISAVTFAPSDITGNTYVFGTEGGALMLTTNGGASWLDVDPANLVPNRFVTHMAFDPSNADLLYVTLSGFDENTPGQPGHVFKSVNVRDAAPTWSNVSPPVNIPHNTVAVDPISSSIVYVGTDLGIWKSVDFGANWTHMGPSSGMPNVAVFELKASQNADRLMAFTHGRGAFILSNVVSTNQSDADLGVQISVAPQPVGANQNFTYTMTVHNAGPAPATGVILTDSLPANLSIFLVTTSQGSTTRSGNLVTASLGTIASGSTATVNIIARATSSGNYSNTVNVTGNENDPSLFDNTATIGVLIDSAQADLQLSGTAAPIPALVGRSLTYSLVVTNAGPSPATGVVVSDPLPTNVVFVSASSSQGVATYSAGAVNASVGTLAAFASAQISIVVQPVSTDTFTNTAQVSSGVVDSDLSNNSVFFVSTPIIPTPRIVAAGARLTAESVQPPNGGIDPGETVTLNLFLQNTGSQSSSNVVATLIAGNGVTSPSGSQNYGLLAPGGISVGRPFSFTAVGTNSGSVMAVVRLQDGTNNLGTVTFTFGLGGTTTSINPALIIINDNGRASLYPSTIFVSGLFGLVTKATVTISNISHTWPDDIDLLLVGPNGQKIMLMSDAGGGLALNNVTLTFDDGAAAGLPDATQISAGTYRPTDFEVGDVMPSPAPAGPYSTSLTSLKGTSPNGSWSLYVVDDQSGDVGRISGGWSLDLTTLDTINPTADISVRLTASPSPVTVNGALTYRISVTNSGPSDSSNVVVTNQLPTGMLFKSAVSSQGTVTNSGSQVIASLGVLTNGTEAIVTILVQPTIAGTASNSVTVASIDTDLNLSNNSAFVLTPVNPSADLSIRISGTPDPVEIRKNLTYSILVSNAGPNVATSVSVVDPLPAGLTIVSTTASQGTAANSSGTINASLGSIAAGATATVTVVVTVPVVGPVTNSASVSSAVFDGNSTNNSATVTLVANNPALIITGSGARLVSESSLPANGSLDSGETVTINFGLRNIGTSTTTSNTVAVLRSGGGVVSPSGPQTYGVLSGGGAAVFRPFTFTATGVNGGLVTAVLDIQDGNLRIGTVTYTFNLASVLSFGNSLTLTIPEQGNASSYPSSIIVTNVGGLISKVSVTLANLTHSFPDDLDILLVGPNGQKAILMSDSGGGFAVNNVTLTFGDDALDPLPDAGQIVTGSYLPTDYEPGDTFGAPAPAGPYGTTLSVFKGISPNGTWSLYIMDDLGGDAGILSDGWSLDFTLSDPVNGAADLSVSGLATPPSVPVGSNVTFAVTVTNQGPATATSVTLTNILPAGATFISASASQGTYVNQAGQVVFSLGTVSNQATVQIVARITAGGTFSNAFSVGAVELDLNTANNSGSVSGSTFIAANFSGVGFNQARQFRLTLAADPAGTYVIEAATNLVYPILWSPVSPSLIPTNGVISFTDSTTNLTRRFYRAHQTQ